MRLDARDDPISKNNWKPWPLWLGYLLTLAALHVIYLGLLELPLRQYKQSPELTIRGSDQGLYFCWQFLPVLGAVILGGFWEMSDIHARRLQPYLAMTRPAGASIRDSLTLDYITDFNLFVPFKAAWRGHWAVVFSSSGYALSMSALPTMAGLMWNVDWENSRTASIPFQVPWLRGVQALNGVLCVLAVALALMMLFRRSGLVREPGNTASIASIICQNPSLLQAFCQIPSYESHQFIEQAFKDARFSLRQVVGTSASADAALQITVSLPDGDAGALPLPTRAYKPSRSEAHPIWLWGRAILLEEVALIAPFLVVQLAIGGLGLDPLDGINPWIPKACFTLSLSLVAMIWQLTQRDLSMLEPYCQMRRVRYIRDRRDARTQRWPLTAEFASKVSSAGWATVVAVRAGAFLLALTSLLTLFQQAAVVFFPPIWSTLYDAVRSRRASLPDAVLHGARVSAGFGWVFSALGFLAVIRVLRKRRRPIVPRQPRTLASQILYLCGSDKLLRAMQGTSMMRGREFDAFVGALTQRHLFGWFQQPEDGRWRVGVEEADPDRKDQPYKFPETSPASASTP